MVTLASQHNGGRVQINLADIFVGADFPLINLIKGSDGWSQSGGTAPVPDPSTLDSDGYPTSIVGGGVSLLFFLIPQADLPGDYILDWSGNGTLTLTGGAFTFVSGSLTSTGGSGAYRFTPGSTTESATLGITAVGSPRITNLRCYHVSEVSRLASGEIFGAKFLDRMQNELKPGVVRDLDWTSGNINCVTKAADLKPTTYVYYKGDEYRSSWYAGDATLSGITYSVSAPSGFGSLSNKNIVQFQIKNNSPVTTFTNPTFTNGSANIGVTAHGMSANDPFFLKSDNGAMPGNFPAYTVPLYVKTVVNSNTITASLTPGGTVITCGAVPSFGSNIYLSPAVKLTVGATATKIMIGHGWPMIAGDNTYPSANKVCTAIYDSALDMYVSYGGCGAYGNRGMLSGVPIEVFTQLCAQIGAHPHIVKEALACYPESDVSTYKATYIRDTYNGAGKPCPWMQPIFEPPNENWNTAADFYGTHYVTSLSAALGGSWTIHEVYGMWLSTMAQKINAVYSNDQTKYLIGCGVQTAAQGDSGWDPRVTAALWTSSGLPAQAGLTAATAKNYGTVVVLPATYWTTVYYGGLDGTGTETDMIARRIAATDPNVKTQILEDYMARSQFASTWPFDLIGLTNTVWPTWKTYAIRTGVTRVRAYEGGISVDYTNGADNTNSFRNAAKGTKVAAAVELAICNNFVGQTGSGVTFEYPSLFHFSDGNRDRTVSGDGWALFSGGATIYGPVSPRYTAVCNWSAGKRSGLRFHT